MSNVQCPKSRVKNPLRSDQPDIGPWTFSPGENEMKHHPAWLATGLLVFVILACNLGKKSNDNNRPANGNSNSSAPTTEADLGSGATIKEIHMAKDDGNGSPGEETDT